MSPHPSLISMKFAVWTPQYQRSPNLLRNVRQVSHIKSGHTGHFHVMRDISVLHENGHARHGSDLPQKLLAWHLKYFEFMSHYIPDVKTHHSPRVCTCPGILEKLWKTRRSKSQMGKVIEKCNSGQMFWNLFWCTKEFQEDQHFHLISVIEAKWNNPKIWLKKWISFKMWKRPVGRRI